MLSLRKYALSVCTLLLFTLLNRCYSQSIPLNQVNRDNYRIRVPQPGEDSSGVYNYFTIDRRIKGRPVPCYTWRGDTVSSIQKLQDLCYGFRNHVGHTAQETIFTIRFKECLSVRDYLAIADLLHSYAFLWDIDLRKNMICVYLPAFFTTAPNP